MIPPDVCFYLCPSGDLYKVSLNDLFFRTMFFAVQGITNLNPRAHSKSSKSHAPVSPQHLPQGISSMNSKGTGCGSPVQGSSGARQQGEHRQNQESIRPSTRDSMWDTLNPLAAAMLPIYLLNQTKPASSTRSLERTISADFWKPNRLNSHLRSNATCKRGTKPKHSGDRSVKVTVRVVQE